MPYIDNIERAKQPERLPVVFTQDEVRCILAQLDGLPRLVTSLLYGSGMRLGECLHQQDLAEGFGAVELPDALAKKYPNVARSWH